MTASWTWYNRARLWAVDGSGLLLPTNAFKAVLCASGYTPDVEAHSVYADLTHELPTALGYTVGGQALTSVALTRTTTTVKFDADDVTWTATGGSLVARYGALYVNATINGHVKPLVGYILLNTTPADVTATDTNVILFQWNTLGIVLIQ